MRILEPWYFGLCWNLRLVIGLWYLEGFWFLLKDFFEDYILAWWNIWISIILLLSCDTFNVNGKAMVWHTPCSYGGQQLSPYGTHTLVTHTCMRSNGFVTPNTHYNSWAQVPLCQKINKSRTKLNYSNLPSEIKKGMQLKSNVTQLPLWKKASHTNPLYMYCKISNNLRFAIYSHHQAEKLQT
jgi:hypothetical protein